MVRTLVGNSLNTVNLTAVVYHTRPSEPGALVLNWTMMLDPILDTNNDADIGDENITSEGEICVYCEPETQMKLIVAAVLVAIIIFMMIKRKSPPGKTIEE